MVVGSWLCVCGFVLTLSFVYHVFVDQLRWQLCKNSSLSLFFFLCYTFHCIFRVFAQLVSWSIKLLRNSEILIASITYSPEGTRISLSKTSQEELIHSYDLTFESAKRINSSLSTYLIARKLKDYGKTWKATVAAENEYGNYVASATSSNFNHSSTSYTIHIFIY